MSMAEAAVVGDVFAELGAIVGREHVVADAAGRELHSRTTETDARRCGSVVYPGSAQEVAAVLRLAARRGLAVWPFSRGNSWGYGTKNAVAPGAVVMVLERMNRILEVNEELAYAVIEPGVTQQQLYEHLQANHPSLIADCTDSTPLGSVLGNAVERGYGYTPYGDHFGHLCGLEVVTPSGEVLRTGGAGEGCPTWNTHKWGSGPALEGLFSQGNLGVVIKAGIWLHPRPEQMLLFTIDIDDGPELAAAVDALHTLSLAGALRSHVHTANAFQTLSLVQKYPADLQARGTRIPDAQLAEMKAQYGVPDWTAVGGLYGSPAQVRAARRELERALRGKGRVAFFDAAKVAQSKKLVALWQRSQGRGLGGRVAKAVKSLVTRKDFALVALLPEMYGVLLGRPTWSVLQSAYFKSPLRPVPPNLDPARDGCGLMWLATAVPMTGAQAHKVLALAEPLFTQFDFNMSACLTMMNERTLFFLLGIFFDQENVAERERAARLYRALHATFTKQGYQQYRGGVPEWTAGEAGAGAARKLLGQVKQVLDPAAVLAPGRYRI
jgi:4-cresol dehydrogenase (hydroxylating) flavoprotein subunit